MRLQLILAIAVCSGPVHADSELAAGARASVYADSDHTTVTTSSATASGNVSPRLRIEAQYLVDAVTSASVDVVSSATGYIHELRHEVTTRATFGSDTRSVHGAVIYSVEHDWESRTFSTGARQDFLQHTLTLGVDGTVGMNRIGKHDAPSFHRSMTSGGGELYGALTVTPRDLVLLGAGLTYVRGYQASPYRFVVYDDLRAVPEDVPETRHREMVTARWNHHMFSDTALRTQVRAYRDSWGVRSITGSAEYVVGIGALDLAVHVRGYAQRPASFYRAIYDRRETSMTSDRELSTFDDGFVGTTLTYRRDVGAHELQLDCTADVFGFAFADVPRLTSRTGMVVGLGISVR